MTARLLSSIRCEDSASTQAHYEHRSVANLKHVSLSVCHRDSISESETMCIIATTCETRQKGGTRQSVGVDV